MTTPEAWTEFFWLVTLQWERPGGTIAASTASGTARLRASGTRSAAWPGILAAARQAAGLPAETEAVVLFCSLEPDSLAAAASPAGVTR